MSSWINTSINVEKFGFYINIKMVNVNDKVTRRMLGIYVKLTANITFNGERLNDFPLKIRKEQEYPLSLPPVNNVLES